MYAVHPMSQNGVNSGAVISFVDMSAQRAAALAREQALVAAENLANVRSAFLANMSHEIRTPLNGVLGFAEIGHRNYQNSEKVREAFVKILTSGKRLLGVINDILDFSKIEAGKLNIEQTEVLLAEVIEHALQLVRDRADAKQIDLRVELAADLPVSCISDPLRMGQILLNILSNAVKFTEEGSVTLKVSRQDEQLVFAVSDSGIGMTAEQQKDLFNPFHQADASSTRRFGGTGLGLAISKRILELMGGEIALQSQPGSGTLVEFRLPFVPVGKVLTAVAPTPVIDRARTRSLVGIAFLVAEDEPVNQAILEENLLEDGARVTVVGNGREAVECIRRNGAAAYDIVLMDIQMPEMDGYEATRQILALAPGLPIIAQTAHAFSEEREKCLAAGMVGHVAKPIDSDALVALVRQFVPAKSQG
jgi:CheY-like chemotaxis protein/nitrogen-specific signal transduction histidine kinase